MMNSFSEQNPALKNLWLSTSNKCQHLNSELEKKNSLTPQLINIVPIRTASSVSERQPPPVPLFWGRDVLQRTDQKNDVTGTVRIHLNVSESTSWLLSFQTLNIKNNEQSSLLLNLPCHFSLFSRFLLRLPRWFVDSMIQISWLFMSYSSNRTKSNCYSF